MSGKVSRAEQKRQYRARQTARYHKLAFIAQYTEIKCESIYNEAELFYEKLRKQYPSKTKIATCPEFIAWKSDTIKGQNMEKQMVFTRTETELHASTTTTTPPPTDLSLNDDMNLNIQLMNPTDDGMHLNIQLMNPTDVEETRTALIFEDIYPSLQQEMNTEIFKEIINEIQESDPNIFNDIDEDMNNMIEAEINRSLNEVDPLEKELLIY